MADVTGEDEFEIDNQHEAEDLGHEGAEQPERLSVRDALEKSWKEHGGELPESRQPKEDRRERPAKDKQPVAAADTGAPGKAAKAADRVPSTEGRQGTEAPQASAAAVPSGWSKEAKAEWDKLPPAVQAAVTKREADMTAGAKQLQDRYGGIHRVVTTQLTAPSRKYGLTPDKILENAVGWFNAIEQNPAEGLKALARVYKIDASNIGAAAPAPAANGSNGQSQPVSDPRIDQLLRTVSDMQNSRTQEVEQAKLDAWSANKPHFAKVRQLMAQVVAGAAQLQDQSILDAGGNVDMDKVYERAIYLDPEVRAQVLKEQAEERRKANAAQVNNARRAGSSVKPGTPGGGSVRSGDAKKAPKGMTVRQSIEHAMSELRS